MSAGEDDLNNRLRAGILDLRSLAADLKEDDKKQKAQSIDQRLAAASAKGENSPRGPEVTQRSPPRTSTPPTPTPPTFTPTTLTSLTSTPAHHHPCHLHPYHCHSYPTSPQLLPLLPPHPSSTLHAALFTFKPSLVQSEVPLRALCTLHASPPGSSQLHAPHPPRTPEPTPPTRHRRISLHPCTSPSSRPPSPLQWLRAAEAMLWKGGDKKGSSGSLPRLPSGSLESARRAAGKKEGKNEGRKGLRDNSPRTQKTSSRARVAPDPSSG